MLLSVFTPFHLADTKYLKEAYESLLKQTYTNWEWILVLNGDALKEKPDLSFIEDERVKTFVSVETGCIGKLKHYSCSKAIGAVVCELDYDDRLTPDCLQEIYNAFQDENIQMAYSNSAEFEVLSNGKWKPNTYSEYFGWRMRPFKYEDKELIEMISWSPSAQMMRRIEFAPNHVRAWRKSSYDEIGGHDVTLKVGDDHDLCCRYYIKYGEKGIKFIDKCLYLYRVHAKNNVKLLNSEIQSQTDKNYLKYSRALAKKWAQDNNLRLLDLGGRFGASEGFETVDLLDADVICNLDEKWWKFEDNSVGVIRASHVFEHLKDSIHTMNEAYRVLAPGGFLFIDVPSTDGRGAWCDPTHISFFNEVSFRYYTNDFYAKYIRPMYKGRFQLSRITTWFPSKVELENGIPIVEADLICLKPPYSDRQVGEKLI